MLPVAMRSEQLLPAALLRLAPDARLVELVRAGSERAFEALFDRHHRPVLAFCRHMLDSHEEAEDVVQHTFLAAYRDLVGSSKPIALRPWLYTIARHRCLTVLRARRERPVGAVPDGVADNVAAVVATREEVRVTLRDVSRLMDDQRAALVLAELGDVSYEDIARILGCPRDKVKALVFQARSSLAADRVARDTPCAEIRQQLSTLVGGALRHATLRRHLRDCPGCRAFRDQVHRQRRALGLLLPVLPTAGLKRAVVGGALGSGGSVGITVGALGGYGLVATALVAVAVPVGGVAIATGRGSERDTAGFDARGRLQASSRAAQPAPSSRVPSAVSHGMPEPNGPAAPATHFRRTTPTNPATRGTPGPAEPSTQGPPNTPTSPGDHAGATPQPNGAKGRLGPHDPGGRPTTARPHGDARSHGPRPRPAAPRPRGSNGRARPHGSRRRPKAARPLRPNGRATPHDSPGRPTPARPHSSDGRATPHDSPGRPTPARPHSSDGRVTPHDSRGPARPPGSRLNPQPAPPHEPDGHGAGPSQATKPDGANGRRPVPDGSELHAPEPGGADEVSSPAAAHDRAGPAGPGSDPGPSWDAPAHGQGGRG